MLDKEEKKTSALLKKKDEAKVMSSSSEVKTGNQETDQLKAQLKNLMIENQKTQRKLRKVNLHKMSLFFHILYFHNSSKLCLCLTGK